MSRPTFGLNAWCKSGFNCAEERGQSVWQRFAQDEAIQTEGEQQSGYFSQFVHFIHRQRGCLFALKPPKQPAENSPEFTLTLMRTTPSVDTRDAIELKDCSLAVYGKVTCKSLKYAAVAEKLAK